MRHHPREGRLAQGGQTHVRAVAVRRARADENPAFGERAGKLLLAARRVYERAILANVPVEKLARWPAPVPTIRDARLDFVVDGFHVPEKFVRRHSA